jgi:Na+/melibiose symporter-like transporter
MRREITSESPPLARRVVAAYSCGHFLNDAAASCWFSYLLLYLQEVQGLTGVEAGAVLFAGQLADAFATPVAGLLSDWGGGCHALGLGRRKFWNAAGVLLVLASFSLLFATCIDECGSAHPTGGAGKTAAYAVAASLFNVG